MDQRPNVSVNETNKPSKLMALLALVIAFALPFILVKSFPHKIKAPMSRNSETSELENQEDFLAEDEDVLEEESPAEPPANLQAAKEMAQVKKPLLNDKKIVKDATIQHNEWTIIKAREGDSLAAVFNRAGLTAQILQNIIHDIPHSTVLTRIKPGQDIQLQIKQKSLEKMIIPFTSTQTFEVYKENGHYKSKIQSRKMNSHNHYTTAIVNGSLYSTAKKYNIPFKLIKQMTDIFTWDINFSKDVRPGDQFTIIYKAFYIEDKLVGTGDIVAVSYRKKGRTFEAIRFTDRQGQSDYYSPAGVSLKKAFNRYPVRFSHISSGFSLARYHPILHYRRPHKGVDLAAPIGTPIFATGSGKIEIIGRQNGYGNMIKIRHDKNYSSIYGHMLRFQKGLSRGDYVRRGQIIGYVGQSGLASGPHCHYEFHINNFPRNPTTVDLPRGLSIPVREMASFRANSRTLIAQLKIYEQARLANNSKNSANKNS